LFDTLLVKLPSLPTTGVLGAQVDLVRGVLDSYFKHRIGLLAAGVAYWALLSLLPVMTLAFSIAGFVLQDDETREDFTNWFADQLPFELSAADRAALADTIGSAAEVSTIGTVVAVLTLIWSATGIFAALRNALNLVFEKSGIGMIRGKALDLITLPVLGVLFAVSFGATIVIQVAQDITTDALGGADPGANFFFFGASHLAALAITVITLLLVYRIVPNHRMGWKELIFPAAVAGFALEVGKVFVSVYLIRFGTQSLYASVGSIFAFLFWAYVSAIIVLVGAALAVELRRLRKEGRRLLPSLHELTRAVRRLRERKRVSDAPM
jgi:membrane protein